MASGPTALITSGKHEMTKAHYVYDDDGRATHIYQAPAGMIDGGPCLVTKYSYYGTSVRVENSIEYEGAWDSAWDLTTD